MPNTPKRTNGSAEIQLSACTATPSGPSDPQKAQKGCSRRNSAWVENAAPASFRACERLPSPLGMSRKICARWSPPSKRPETLRQK
jgi:hypothetical protein